MRAQHGHIKYFITLLVGFVIGLSALVLVVSPAWSGEVSTRPPAGSPPVSARPTVVQGVNVHPDGGKLIIEVQTNGTPTFKTFDLENPQRIVVDVMNAVLDTDQHRFPVDQGNIRSVRLAQYSSTPPQTVRAVITATGKVAYTAVGQGNAIRLVVEKATPNKGVDLAVKPTGVPAATKVDKPTVKQKEPPSDKSAASPVGGPVHNAPPKAAAQVKPVSGPLMASLKPTESALPKDSTATKPTIQPLEKKAVPEKQKAAAKPTPTAEGSRKPSPAVAVAGDAAGRAAPKVEQAASGKTQSQPAPAKAESPFSPTTPPASGKAPVMVAAVQPQAPGAPAQPVPASAQAVPPPQAQPAMSVGNSSDIISLDLRDVDIRDFFRLIHEVSGLNVILDPSVRGTLTIALKDVPWTQALDIVLRNNQLGKQLEGNVLRIMTLKSLEDEQKLQRELLTSKKAEEEAATKRTFTRTLNYLKAKDLVVVFNRLLNPGGVRGTDDVIADDNTNMVVVRTTPRRMEELDAILKSMDVKKQQVEIEARVVTANRSFLRDIGVQLGAQIFSDGRKSILTGSPITTLDSPNNRQPRPPISSAPPATTAGQPVIGPLPLNMALGAVAPTSSLGYVFNGANALIDSFITASESKGLAKLLSKPKIITQNNVEGTVNQGTKIPLQTVVNNTVTTTYVDAVLELKVRPHITEEGTIFLDVSVKRDTPDFTQQVGGAPTIQTQSLVTQVLLNDGGTVVVGGVLIDDNEYTIRQVPGLGNIPIIGNAFRNKSVTHNTQELLFFVTPKIMQ